MQKLMAIYEKLLINADGTEYIKKDLYFVKIVTISFLGINKILFIVP